MTTLQPQHSAPTPYLRIVPTNSLHPHEEHDSQRLLPLIDRLRRESVMLNPPIVAPMDDHSGQYVVLDGANRTSAFSQLGFPHVLVQVVDYDSPYVQLETWHHVVCAWTIDAFEQHLHHMPHITLSAQATVDNSLASVHLRDNTQWVIHTPDQGAAKRNHALVEFVSVYQRNAVLHRTALHDPTQVWQTHDDGIALVVFPPYHPQDVIIAARERAYIPPGITRHIIQGRALRVNYPLEILRDAHTSIEDKNRQLDEWMKYKIDQRQMRYYAESTYQFDE